MSSLRMTKPISSFIPPKRLLLGPGPSNVSTEVLKAMARPTIGHLDPTFVDMMEEVKTLLRDAFQTENTLTFPISGPGSLGMETCFVNLVEPGDKVVVCRNGVFGGRMKENVTRSGGVAVMQEDAWGTAVDPNKLEDILKNNRDAKVVAFVHAETSTGASSDVKTLVEIAHSFDCLTIVDAVTSLGGTPLKVDEWQIDAIYSGTQKCLSCAPGLSPVSFSERVVEMLKKRKSPVQSWFMDLNLILGYWGNAKRVYHHTAPINALYGLHEALILLHKEGLEQSWARHKTNHLALKAGVAALGLEFFVAESQRLPQLNTLVVPEGIDEAKVRQRLLDEYNVEVGAGLGEMAGKIWRVGLMGHSSLPENVLFFINALGNILKDMRGNINVGEAEASVKRFYKAHTPEIGMSAAN